MKERKQGSTNHPMTFLMVSSTDHITGKGGLSPEVSISKDGGSLAEPSGAITQIGNGWYALAGHAWDRDTTGEFVISASGAGADQSDTIYCIVPWDPFDANMSILALSGLTAPTAGALLTSGSGTNQLHVVGGRADANVLAWDNEFVPTPTTSGVPEVWVNGYDSGKDPGTYLTNQGYTTTRAIKLDVLVTLEASGIVNDATPGSGSFLGSSNLSASGAYFNNSYLAFTGGQNQALSRRILSYTGGTHGFTFYNPFPLTPSSGDPFVILGGSI